MWKIKEIHFFVRGQNLFRLQLVPIGNHVQEYTPFVLVWRILNTPHLSLQAFSLELLKPFFDVDDRPEARGQRARGEVNFTMG